MPLKSSKPPKPSKSSGAPEALEPRASSRFAALRAFPLSALPGVRSFPLSSFSVPSALPASGLFGPHFLATFVSSI